VKYKVYVMYTVSQIVEVEAHQIEEAIEAALDEVDHPNISNKFDMDGDPEAHAVYDDNDHEVWHAP